MQSTNSVQGTTACTHGYVDLPEHLSAPPGIQQCNVLWCGDNHGPRERDLLRDGELCVSRARGKVHYKHV